MRTKRAPSVLEARALPMTSGRAGLTHGPREATPDAEIPHRRQYVRPPGVRLAMRLRSLRHGCHLWERLPTWKARTQRRTHTVTVGARTVLITALAVTTALAIA